MALAALSLAPQSLPGVVPLLLGRPVGAERHTIAAHSFTGADSNTSPGVTEQGRYTFTANGNSAFVAVYGITSNKGYLVSTNGADAMTWFDIGRFDWLHLAVDVTPLAGSGFPGLIWRYQDSTNYLIQRLAQTGAALQFARNLATARSVVQQGLIATTAGVSVHLDLYVLGTRFLLLLNGVIYVDVQDTHFTTATKVGLYAVAAGVGTTQTFDNLLVEGL